MAPKAQRAWQIYEEQMECHSYGHALWEPAPTKKYTRINIGDVGFIREGRFHLLFSAGIPLGERERGIDVPNTFEPLQGADGLAEEAQPRGPGCVAAKTCREAGAKFGVTVPILQSSEPDVELSVTLIGDRGAALTTRHPTYNEDSQSDSEYRKYTKRHYKSWVKFASDKMYGDDLRPVLVSGFDMTKDFAIMAYSNHSPSVQSDSIVSTPMFGSTSTSASPWGVWRTECTPYVKHGPQRLRPPDLPSLQSGAAESLSTEFNQCVFLRYYTMREGLFPKVIRAGAGPHDLGSGENRGDTFPELTARPDARPLSGSDGDPGGQWDHATDDTGSELDTVVRNVPYDEEHDCWDAIAAYVFQNSEAKSVLMHHKDLAGIRAMGDESDISHLLNIHKPHIVVDEDGVGGIVCEPSMISPPYELVPSNEVATPRPPAERDVILSALEVAIGGLNLTKGITSFTPAKDVFGTVSVLLTMMKDSQATRTDCVELGLTCAYVCNVIYGGINGRTADQLSPILLEAIEHLMTIVEEIQRNFSKIDKPGDFSCVFHYEDDGTIAGWKLDLNRILHVFNSEPGMNAHVEVLNTSIHGESPPPPPRACFGRAELVEKIVYLAQDCTPIALIGPGGIGKTSVALAVLHDGWVKEQFGENRLFIRCDQFPASSAHFLARLSKAIGAGIENPEDLTPLRPSLSSNEMLIVLDNAESILAPQENDGQEIYRLVEELSGFNNICLVITSRITAIPSYCEAVEVEALSAEAAHDTFYNIYECDERSESVNDILEQLDFHPLSVALLATVAHQNRWDNNRLVREWEEHQTGMLETEHEPSLATTTELSLGSPMFRELGPDALGLLGVVAFYPQGIYENNVAWLFPNIPNGSLILDKFCMLSLTHRSNGFITMLAPLRDLFRPKAPGLSPLLCTTKERYLARMSAKTDPCQPGFEDSRWILTEDVNVEHLLDVFITVNPDQAHIWDACVNFLDLLRWHKPRQTVLRKKIEELPDDHPYKSQGLVQLALLPGLLGTKPVGGGFVPIVSVHRSAIIQALEKLEVCEELGKTLEGALGLVPLALLMKEDGELDAAEDTLLESIRLLPEEGQEFSVCASHQALGDIYRLKGETGKAVYHHNLVTEIASTLNWHRFLYQAHFALANIYLDEDSFEYAQAHIEQAKTPALGNAYSLGPVVLLQARIWYRQHEYKNAASEALRAQEIFKQLGNMKELESCETLIRDIEEAMKSPPASSNTDSKARDTSTSEKTPRGTSPSTSEKTPRDPDHKSGQLFLAPPDSLFLAHGTSPGTSKDTPSDPDHKSGRSFLAPPDPLFLPHGTSPGTLKNTPSDPDHTSGRQQSF